MPQNQIDGPDFSLETKRGRFLQNYMEVLAFNLELSKKSVKAIKILPWEDRTNNPEGTICFVRLELENF